MSDDHNDEGAGYEVGYGKPPKEHQFKKGHTKSKGPRRKRRPSFAVMFEEEYFENVAITEGGKKRTLPAIRAIMRRHKLKALNGDEKATIVALKIAQQFMPQDPYEEGEEHELSDAEMAVMKDVLAAKSLFGIGDDE